MREEGGEEGLEKLKISLTSEEYFVILTKTMKDQKRPEKLMTLEEVAGYLRLSVHTIYTGTPYKSALIII